MQFIDLIMKNFGRLCMYTVSVYVLYHLYFTNKMETISHFWSLF